MTPAATSPTVWDWPLRLWHWAFAGLVAFSLYTGLTDDISWLTWHQRSGIGLVGLLAFRLGWALWGGIYARWRQYRTTPRAFLAHFRGLASQAAHTAPGTALALALFALVALQVATGLFATDDIFTEGPLHRLVSAEFASVASWIHRRLHWLVLGLVGVHLLAHAIYGLVLRDATPLTMFTGRKPVPLPPTPNYWLRGIATAIFATAFALAVANAGWVL